MTLHPEDKGSHADSDSVNNASQPELDVALHPIYLKVLAHAASLGRVFIQESTARQIQLVGVDWICG